MDQIVKWQWPTPRERKLYAFLDEFGIAGAEVMLVSEVGLDLPVKFLALVVGLGSAPLVMPALHVLRLHVLRCGSDRWT